MVLIIKSVCEFIVKCELVVVWVDLCDIFVDVVYFIELCVKEVGVMVVIV